MSNLPVDRDKEYMKNMWGTNKLVTDYNSLENKTFIQEVMTYDESKSLHKHELKKQTDLHEKIRNDEDYDDWEYGTEPSYGYPWNEV
jgi:hypothetical protein